MISSRPKVYSKLGEENSPLLLRSKRLRFRDSLSLKFSEKPKELLGKPAGLCFSLHSGL